MAPSLYREHVYKSSIESTGSQDDHRRPQPARRSSQDGCTLCAKVFSRLPTEPVRGRSRHPLAWKRALATCRDHLRSVNSRSADPNSQQPRKLGALHCHILPRVVVQVNAGCWRIRGREIRGTNVGMRNPGVSQYSLDEQGVMPQLRPKAVARVNVTELLVLLSRIACPDHRLTIRSRRSYSVEIFGNYFCENPRTLYGNSH